MKKSASRETSQAVAQPPVVRVRIVLRPGAVKLGGWTGGEIVDCTPEQAEALLAKGCQLADADQNAAAPADADAAAAAAGEGGGASSTPSAE